MLTIKCVVTLYLLMFCLHDNLICWFLVLGMLSPCSEYNVCFNQNYLNQDLGQNSLGYDSLGHNIALG